MEPSRRRRHRGLCLLLAWAALGASPAGAQSAPPQAPPASPANAEADRPGQFRLGPFFVTPYLRIGSIGVDTNVFFTSADRQRDFSISGGPGLDIVLPVKRKLRFLVGGGGEYLFFADHRDQRRLTGSARGRVDFQGQRITLGGEEGWAKTFTRPSFEVDDRIEQEEWRTRGELHLRPGQGRFTVSGVFTLEKIDVAGGQVYLGSDLSATLSRKESRSLLELSYGLTTKTFFVVEGDYQQDRFTHDPSRDADSNRLAGGFQVVSATRLSGRAVAGVRWFRPRDTDGADLRTPYADVDLSYAIGRSTRLQGRYSRDLRYSAFSPAGLTPTLRGETGGGSLDQRLFSHLWIRLTGSLGRYTSDGAIRVEIPGQGTVRAVREDKFRQAGADLGWQFPFKLRVGIGAFYTDRRSTISYFGVDGLSVGLTVNYTGTPAVNWRP